MNGAPPRIVRCAHRRGAFGLDERRLADPARVEAGLRAFLAGRLPDVWTVPAPDGSEPDGRVVDPSGRTLALLLPRGHVAMLRIERDPDRPGAAARALAERCRAMRIPHATVSSVEAGLAALRRLGLEPRPGRPSWAAPGPVLGRVRP